MKKFVFFLFLAGGCIVHAQNYIPDIDDNSQNAALLDITKSKVIAPDMDLSQEPFIAETHQIPAYGLYGQLWDKEHLRSKQFTIPFSDGILKIILVESYNSPFIFPCRGNVVHFYGAQRRGGFHTGIDFQLNYGAPIYACFDGVVRMAKYYGDYGNVVVIRHYNGIETVYAHLNNIYVKSDQVVKAGHIVGQAGNSGNTNDVLLHFETRFLNEYFDPALLLNFEDRTLNSNILTLDRESFNIQPIPQKNIPPATTEQPVSTSIPKIKDDSTQKKNPVSDIKVVAVENGTSEPVIAAKSEKENIVTDDDGDIPPYHIIQKGETLYRVSVKYNIPVKELIRINKLSDKGTVHVGQKIKLR